MLQPRCWTCSTLAAVVVVVVQSASDCKIEDDGMSTLQVHSQRDVCSDISNLITSGKVVYLGPENWTDAVYNCGFKSVIYLNSYPAGVVNNGAINFMALAQQKCSDNEFYGMVMCQFISDPKFCENGANEGVPMPGLYPGHMRNQMWQSDWIMSVSDAPLPTGNVKQACTYNSIDGFLSTDAFAEFANDVFAECSGAGLLQQAELRDGLRKETTEASPWCRTKPCHEVIPLCKWGNKCCDYAKWCALHPKRPSPSPTPTPTPTPVPTPTPTPAGVVILDKNNFSDYVFDAEKDADIFVDFYSAE